MQKYDVEYLSGDSILTSGKVVDYMLAVVTVKGKEVELYAEKEKTGNQSQTYMALRDEIIAQAKDFGIPEESLIFANKQNGLL